MGFVEINTGEVFQNIDVQAVRNFETVFGL
jgi:hypothetical protein